MKLFGNRKPFEREYALALPDIDEEREKEKFKNIKKYFNIKDESEKE